MKRKKVILLKYTQNGKGIAHFMAALNEAQRSDGRTVLKLWSRFGINQSMSANWANTSHTGHCATLRSRLPFSKTSNL